MFATSLGSVANSAVVSGAQIDQPGREGQYPYNYIIVISWRLAGRVRAPPKATVPQEQSVRPILPLNRMGQHFCWPIT